MLKEHNRRLGGCPHPCDTTHTDTVASYLPLDKDLWVINGTLIAETLFLINVNRKFEFLKDLVWFLFIIWVLFSRS